MSFSTERFFTHIDPQDITELTFKLYDARLIGSLTNPSPSAIITQYNNAAYDAVTNPTGRPGSFSITGDAVLVLVSSSELDDYEQTRLNSSTSVFRGELYGYIEAEVTGEQTKYVRFNPVLLQNTLNVQGNLTVNLTEQDDEWWDGYFFPEDIRVVVCKSTCNTPTLGITS